MTWLRRFHVHGVIWRKLLRWGVLNVPHWLEPILISTWALIFLLWAPGRRGVMQNLSLILPGSNRVANLFRTYRVFWSFAWTTTENVRFQELQVSPDWEFEGTEHFETLQRHAGGGIILTAHMGSYDLGAALFAERSARPVRMVRAPETDPDTRRYEEGRITNDGPLRVDFSSRAADLALELLESLRDGQLIAIQGDRVTPGISTAPTTLFGAPVSLPSGPFALAMAARVPIFPLFIVRLGRRRYRVVTAQPFDVVRTANRNESLDHAVRHWSQALEATVRPLWFQWFHFEPIAERPAA